MSNYLQTETYGRHVPQFLADEHYVTETRQFKTSDGVDVDGRKIVKAGTVYSTSVASGETTTTVAYGIVFEDVDVTNGDELGAVLIGGRVYSNRITITSAQMTALQAKGIFFDEYPETTR